MDNVDNIHAQECGLYSDKYKVAGRVDCIAEWHGKLAVIDFKTSAKPKKPEWITNYFCQETAYAKMFEERTGERVESIVTLIAVSDGTSQLFIDEPSDRWVDQLVTLRNEYREQYGK